MRIKEISLVVQIFIVFLLLRSVTLPLFLIIICHFKSFGVFLKEGCSEKVENVLKNTHAEIF